MAATRPIAVITRPHGLDEARAMLPELAHELADEVRRRYGSRYEIELHGSVDGGELADTVLGESNRPVADAETMQTLRVSQGWLMGAMVALRWSATTPDRVLLTSETQSKLEDRASTVIVGGAGCLGALAGLLSIRLRLIGMLVGACLGLVLGIGAYKVFAAPIFAVIQAGRRRVSTALAVELGSVAARVIQASPFVDGPAASSEPAAVPAPAPDRALGPVEEVGAVRTAGPAADRPSPFRRPPSSKPGPHAAIRT
jgi:hypothetical protein